MIRDDILKYADITLRKVVPNEAIKLDRNSDTEIKFDYYDSSVTNSCNDSLLIYSIYYQENCVGMISLYQIDNVNRIANIYGYVYNKRHYFELIKALLLFLKYSFTELSMNKLYFLYREDNHFFDEVCSTLGFVREGLLRGQLTCGKTSIDVNLLGMLDYEYRRLSKSEYKRMFSWDYSFDPHDVEQLNFTYHFNRRLFTNSIDNPNHAWINDWLGEYVLNQEIPDDRCLHYKGIRFQVNIFNYDYDFDCFSCNNQKINVACANYSDLLLITTAQFGYKQEFIIAEYEDETREECEFTISDWCDKTIRDEHVIYSAAACRCLGPGANMIKCHAFVYLQRVKLDSSKILRRIIFPDNHDIFIFAGALCT